MFRIAAAAACLVVSAAGWAGEALEGPDAPAVAALSAASCADCHFAGNETGFDVEVLSRDPSDPAAFRAWERAYDRVHRGEMPPADAGPADPAAVAAALAELSDRLTAADRARRARAGRVPARRLTKTEYAHTLRDLLQITGEVAAGVPGETGTGGFDVVGAHQRLSAVHVRAYLEAADAALNRAIRLGRDPRVDRDLDPHESRVLEEFHEKPVRLGGNITRRLDEGAVLFRDADYLLNSGILGFGPPAAGVYEIRARVEAYQAEKPLATKLIRKGPGGDATLLATPDLTPGDVRELVVQTHLEPGDVFYFTPQLRDAEIVSLYSVGAKKYRGPGLALRSLNVRGPLAAAWPPESTRALFGDGVRYEKRRDGSYEVAFDGAPGEKVRDVLRRFLPRAFRRPVGDDEVEPLARLADAALADGRAWEDAVRVPLRAALTDPRFLLFGGEPGALDDFALAERLSLFLTKTAPDAELTALAAAGELTDPETLRAQTERLLGDPRSDRFVRDFLGQWLRLNHVDATAPDATLYPEYDEVLGKAIPEETVNFFRHLLDENLPADNLIDSDFTFVNRRLAEHYGLADVEGQHFRRVALAADSPRGGVLTQAAILKTTANGTVTSPVLRGNFVLSNLLGTPPSPPPPGVGSVEPDTRGAATVRELLAKHRNDASCAKCHAAIDPPGFALESFDPIGGYRTRYRAIRPAGAVAAFFGGGETVGDGPAVDPSGVTAGGVAFADIREFKARLLDDRETVARHLLSRLVVYGTGGEISFADRAELGRILDATRGEGFPVRDLLHVAVQSDLFRNK